VIELITRGVHELAPSASVVVSPSEPIVGAALLGLDALGVDTGAGTRARAALDAATNPGYCASRAGTVESHEAGFSDRVLDD
jgi:hypothetical protein